MTETEGCVASVRPDRRSLGVEAPWMGLLDSVQTDRWRCA